MNGLALLVLCVAAVNAHREEVAAPADVEDVAGIFLTPAYTKILDNVDKASARVKSLLGPKNLNTQYTMIVSAVNKLMEIGKSPPAYYDLYFSTIDKAILDTLNDPQKSADTVRTQVDKILSKIQLIREVINSKQNSVCKDKISYKCDLIVDIAVRTSSDSLLKAQAHLIQTIGTEVDSYVNNYADEFESVAKSDEAESYLVNSIEHLWPLAHLGGLTREEAKSVLPSRRFSSVIIELDD